MSAYMPPTAAIGALAKIPVKHRKATNDSKFGAKEQAKVKAKYATKVYNMTGFRPMVSLSGPKTSGPSTYPIK